MKNKGYFVHPTAIVEAEQVGRGTRIWAFCNIQKGARIGSDCNICDHCFVEQGVVIGDGVTVKNGVSLWNGVIIENNVFIGPNAVFTNDIYPRSKVRHNEVDKTLIQEGVSIGANAVVVAGHTVGQFALVGAGTVVTKDVPDFTLWFGNPAEFVGYVCKCAQRLEFPQPVDSQTGDARFARCAACGREYRLVDGSVTCK